MIEKERVNEDISMSDFLRIFKIHRRSIVATSLILAIFALIFHLTFIPRLYQADAVVYIGKVNNELIEAAPILSARLSQKSFISKVIASNPSLFLQDKSFGLNINTPEILLSENMQKNENLLFFSIRARSRKLALMQMSAILSKIKSVHDEILYKKVAAIQNDIELTDTIINQTMKSINTINSIRSSAHHNANIDDFSIAMVTAKLAEIQIHKLNLEEKIAVDKTFKTSLLDEVYVSPEPVSRSPFLIVIASLCIGFFGALIIALIRESKKV